MTNGQTSPTPEELLSQAAWLKMLAQQLVHDKALLADLFVSPLLAMKLGPRIGLGRGPARPTTDGPSTTRRRVSHRITWSR